MKKEKLKVYEYLINGIEEVYKNTNKSKREFIDTNWRDLCEGLINEFKQKVKQ